MAKYQSRADELWKPTALSRSRSVSCCQVDLRHAKINRIKRKIQLYFFVIRLSVAWFSSGENLIIIVVCPTLVANQSVPYLALTK